MSCCGACGGQDTDKNKEELVNSEQDNKPEEKKEEQETAVNTFTPE